MQVDDRAQVLQEVVGVLRDMTSDWGVELSGGIQEGTRLVGDLSFESIEVVQLMIALEQHFKLKKLASERLLMEDGRYVEDIAVAQIVDFLAGEIRAQ